MKKNAPINELLKHIKNPVFAFLVDNNLSFISNKDKYLDHMAEHPTHHFYAYAPPMTLEQLGDRVFRLRHGLTYNYVAGAMANGITSAAMVKAMAKKGMLAFLGAGGLSLEKIEENIIELKNSLKNNPFGFNLIHSLADPEHEMATVELYLKHQIRLISAAAFMRMTLALVYYRIKGIHQDASGRIITPNQIVAKVSRIEIARQFFSPPPDKLVQSLLEKQMITQEEARLSRYIPMAYDLTAEADSGGHTDNRPALALLPTVIALKNEFVKNYDYPEPLCVGLAGGIATPQSAAAAFSMGAAYILTGSVNQSCVEAGICDDVKQMLCQAQQADVAMAPAADMFEIGARVQVLKRGTMFPVRAEKLYKFYQAYDCFDDIDAQAKKEIEEKMLQTSFEKAWESTRAFFLKNNHTREIENAQQNPKHKMALVFRSYLGLSSKWAIQGLTHRKMDYQIWCGPAIGAFNQWVKDSFLAEAENRKVTIVALNLLMGASISLRASMLRSQGIQLPDESELFAPMPFSTLSNYI
jgi:trans-AT polyketide synthase/acyltransferase/oxidoreductase domain-containing protein